MEILSKNAACVVVASSTVITITSGFLDFRILTLIILILSSILGIGKE